MKPEKVLNFAEKDSWLQAFQKFQRSFLNDEVVREIKGMDSTDFSSDELLFLESAYKRQGIYFSLTEFEEKLLTFIKKEFKFFKGFHGTKILNIKNFQLEGLIPLSLEYLFDELKLLFSHLDLMFPLKEIETLCKELNESRKDSIYFYTAYSQSTNDGTGHYLIYGSETISGILTDLNLIECFRDFLLKRGQATLIECNVPISFIPNFQLKNLSKEIFTRYFQVRSNSNQLEPNRFSFWIKERLDPKYICSFHHPEELVDPLQRDRTFVFDSKGNFEKIVKRN